MMTVVVLSPRNILVQFEDSIGFSLLIMEK